MSGDCSSSATTTPQVDASKPRSELVYPMSPTMPRTMRGMSTYASVVISPATTTRPVVQSTSQATRPSRSSASTASSTPSEIWSATLSGCPSVTDSDENRNSLTAGTLPAATGATRWLSLLRGLARHQARKRIQRRRRAVRDAADRLGDRQLQAVVAGQVAQRGGSRQPLGHLSDLLLDPVRRDALGEQFSGPPVSGQLRRAGGDQIAHAGHARVRARPGTECLAHARHLGHPAGDDRGLGVVAEPEPVGYPR